ncbi:hypothetical protein MIR68_002002 [Amoeboaphelidium protococcarum]|nr:hypothetical protein MIR68_002002 [Amoeboaphelidium protococcarum]
MQSILLVSDRPVRRLALLPRSVPGKESQYALLLENLAAPQQQSGKQCTARFQQITQLDHANFKQLLNTPIYGTLGLVQVDKEPFVCVITDQTLVGKMEGSSIYRINNVMFFSLTNPRYDNVSDNGSSYLVKKEFSGGGNVQFGPDGQLIEDYESIRHPCAHLQKFLSTGSFYYSYDFDLTNSAQNRQQIEKGISIWETADDRFFWNAYLIGQLLKFRRQLPAEEQSALDREGLLVMAINGFVRVDQTNIYGEAATLALISRLSCRRSGTRFNTRGIDDDGNVANNAETEMLIYAKNQCFSYLIIRGSVPVFWEQQGLQLGQHKIQLSRSLDASRPAFEKHFKDISDRYGQCHVVNLLGSIKENSAEVVLSDAFNSQIKLANLDPVVQCTNFDFHAVTKGEKYENVVMLQRFIQQSMDQFGYFHFDGTAGVVRQFQSGVFRVNCLDCLDRTNVVEGYLCKIVSSRFTQSVLNLHSDTLFSQFMNDIWADNGDELSKIYTGTGALKSGFTRTGKRSIMGMMDDARKTAQRLYVNNFQDKSKQEVIDLLLGKLANQLEIILHNPISEAVNVALESRITEWASKTSISVHVATWNVNGKQPTGENISSWLKFDNLAGTVPDMLVVGFQEIVELSPQQIMATDVSKRLVWEELLIKTLNSVYPNQKYVLLKSDQLVGAALSVFVKSCHLQNIRNVHGAVKKTGMAGLAGNKGGIGIRMDFYDTSLCFVCAHLAAGHSNYADRNADYKTINDGMVFKQGSKILDNEAVFWLGDFNYRIDSANDEVRGRINKGDHLSLLALDQLGIQMRLGGAFQGFQEGKITFPPTYRFDVGTNDYDTSEKARIPAWTDRVLFKGQGVKLLSYGRAELTSSDHKPVKAMMQVELKIVNKQIKDQIQIELMKQYNDGILKASVIADTVTKLQSADGGMVAQRGVTQQSVSMNLIDIDDGPSAQPPPRLPPRPVMSNAQSANFNWMDGGNSVNDMQFDSFKSKDRFVVVDSNNKSRQMENPFADQIDVQARTASTKPPIPQRQTQIIDNPFADEYADPWK